jgi:hypothetical protein
MRKSLVFFFLIVALLSSAPTLASPLHLRESNIRASNIRESNIRESDFAIFTSADAGNAAWCSIDPHLVLRDNRASVFWPIELNRKGFAAADAGYNADDRRTPRGGLVSDEAAAQPLLLAPPVRGPRGQWLSAGADSRPNVEANATANHLFAPPDGVNLFITQTGNDRPIGARDSNATLAAVQLVIH